jgi:hypothetical protein
VLATVPAGQLTVLPDEWRQRGQGLPGAPRTHLVSSSRLLARQVVALRRQVVQRAPQPGHGQPRCGAARTRAHFPARHPTPTASRLRELGCAAGQCCCCCCGGGLGEALRQLPRRLRQRPCLLPFSLRLLSCGRQLLRAPPRLPSQPRRPRLRGHPPWSSERCLHKAGGPAAAQ